MNSMLTVEEVKTFLEIEHDDLERLLKQQKLHAYKIGGQYVRFRKDEVLNLRLERSPKSPARGKPLAARVGDFWRFNNFYIVSLVIAAVVMLLVLRSS